MTNYISTIGRIFRGAPPVSGTVVDDRITRYDVWQAYYDNYVYNLQIDGGYREIFNTSLGRPQSADLAGLYAPISEVVDLYQHLFRGTFGKDITVDTENPMIVEPLNRIWQMSNMHIEKQELCQIGPTHGNVGLRLVTRRAERVEDCRISIKVEEPRVIRDAMYDDRNNLSEILMRYEVERGIGDAKTVKAVEELQTKDDITVWEIKDGKRDTMLSREPNEFGFVPYVILTHLPSGGTWGHNAFYRTLAQIDRINVLMTHVNEQIGRHVRVVWVIGASGAAPTNVDLSGEKIIYINLQKDGTPPLITPLVANLDLGGALAQIAALIEQVENKLPELKATAGKFLANQSGETVMQLRKPAEDRLNAVLPNYEDGLIRIQQMALSAGIQYGMWDLGTGSGTRESADAAYQQGLESHTFRSRSLLPEDRLDTLKRESEIAGLMKSAGYSMEMIAVELGKEWVER